MKIRNIALAGLCRVALAGGALAGGALVMAAMALPAVAAPIDGVDPIPPRTQGVGPYASIVLRNVTVIDGTGAPPQGPMDIVIQNDRIAKIVNIGPPSGKINESIRPPKGDYEMDLTGYTVMPGFVDAHVHLHRTDDAQGVPSDYILKLWLASGVTQVRDLGSGQPIEWLVDVKRRAAANEIVSPRIDVYPFFHDISGPKNTVADARAAIRDAKKRGVDGIKFIGAPEDVLMAAIDETKKIGLHSTMHHAQNSVFYANVLTTSAAGLESMEHWYGLPEAMFTDKTIQRFPVDYINNDEMMRFGEAGRLWAQSAPPGSDKWKEVMDTLLERKFILDPTFVAYLTSRDFMRMSRAAWHEEYTMPSLWDFYRASRESHGAYWFDWTTEHEMAWRENYQLWMKFVNEYKNRGGAVTVGSDSGYIYNLYGFGYTTEMELLREAGFSPLEVIHAATQVGARALGHEDQIGTVRVGRKADLVVVKGNPVANMKLLYGTGTILLNDETGKVERVGAISYTIKDGIVYDAEKLRAEVRAMVAKSKAERGLPPTGIMPIANAN